MTCFVGGSGSGRSAGQSPEGEKGTANHMGERRDTECQTRMCRACNEAYDYPVPKSAATRFYCGPCAELPARVRAMFEKYNRRIKALVARIDKLEQRNE